MNTHFLQTIWKAIKHTLHREDKKHIQSPTASPIDKKTVTQPKYREIKWHGLILRSNSEVKIAKELDLQGIMFIAGAKIRLNTERHRQTREVDFLIHHNGQWGILEVDGPHHQHSVEADGWRDKRFEEHGIRVIRFSADRCYSKPRVVIAEFLTALAIPPESPDLQSSPPDV